MHSPAVGKNVGGYLYIHIDVVDNLPRDMGDALAHALQFVRDKTYNVLKIKEDLTRITFLNYPDFFTEGFPELKFSWLVDLATGEVKYRDYSESLNPPILHRKEVLLGEDHSRYEEFASLTREAENLDLFSKSRHIGYRQYWEHLLTNKGYSVSGNQLVPIGNIDSNDGDALFELGGQSIQRHLTALTRYGFSAPIQAISRFGYLEGGKVVFDYGCGKGDDVTGLLENGVEAFGWDPYFRPDGERREADIVNLGFVINVIEDPQERAEALRHAYGFARELLVVSAMVGEPRSETFLCYSDGLVTGRGTFQKYFHQDELKNYIESVLDRTAIPVSPGVFFVFSSEEQAEAFALKKISNRRRRLAHSGDTRVRASISKSVLERVFENHPDVLRDIWERWLELGRPPEKFELPESSEIIKIRSYKSLLAELIRRIDNGDEIIKEAQRSRYEDLLVFFAQTQFTGNKRFRALSQRLKLDIKVFFGSYNDAMKSGRALLFSLSDVDVLRKAALVSVENGLGHLEEDAFFTHSSLVPRLPSVLRAYILCGTNLFGDIESIDLIKVHLTSNKLSLMKYSKFKEAPLPKLQSRFKLNLRTTDIDVFTYGGDYPATYLYRKSLYMNEEFPEFVDQVDFEAKLTELGMLGFEGYGPSVEEFDQELRRKRYEVSGMSLVRSTEIPDLDSPCGDNFTFRSFIECGDTQGSLKIQNIPTEVATYNALYDLAVTLIDPIVDYFGPIKLTYGFCSTALSKKITKGIAPKLDQHASYERNRRGNLICARGGAACDFIVEDEDMFEVVEWIHNHLHYDRVYFYGASRPIHISYSESPMREAYHLVSHESGRVTPKKIVFRK